MLRLPQKARFRTGLTGAHTLRLQLSAFAHNPTVGGLTVCEVPRDEVGARLPAPEFRVGSLEAIDRGAGANARSWRCFVAMLDGHVVHHSFVAMQPRGPLLWRVFTLPSARGRGAFVATVGHIASTLYAEGERVLWSSTAVDNPVSLRAHQRAGFELVDSYYDVRVAGVRLRPLLKRWLRRG